PSDRLSYMLADSQIRVMVTQRNLIQTPTATDFKVICVEDMMKVVGHLPDSNPRSMATAENAVYVIYTSGSTGKPKGVVIIHRGLSNYLQWAGETYASKGADGSLIHTSIGFDLTVTSVYLPLLEGNRVVVVGQAPYNSE